MPCPRASEWLLTSAEENCTIKGMDKLVFRPGERVSHAYIVASASEEARRGTALRLAAAMLCESSGDRPCGDCRHCRKVFSGIHPDVVSVAPALDDKGRKRREILVEQVRFISADAQVMPNEARVKVYAIHDAERMNAAAQNALLKLLEEPPASAAFILCASNPALLLPTVRSRCVLLRQNADEAGAARLGIRPRGHGWPARLRHARRRQGRARGHPARGGPRPAAAQALRRIGRAFREMLRHAQAQHRRQARVRPHSCVRGKEMRKLN